MNKYNKYAADIMDVPFKFQPIVFEASGGFDKPAVMLINKIAHMISSQYGIPHQIVNRNIINEMSLIFYLIRL